MNDLPRNFALTLGAGGARAAYQVGVLRFLARLFPDLCIPILTGVSAGAINTAFLANYTGRFADGTDRLRELWQGLTLDRIFRSNAISLAMNVARWGMRLVSGGMQLSPPTRGLVDTAPLRSFLHGALGTTDGTLHGVAENLRSGRLRSVGVTTTNYATGQSVTWVQGERLSLWERPLRRGESTTLAVDHVMGSCALPLFFPAIRIGPHWHGDGGVHLTAPLSPALHLGAERIFAVSTRYLKSTREAEQPVTTGYPPPATVIGVLLNSVFLDMLDYDAMTLQRLNRLVVDLPEEKRMGLRQIQLLVMRPSRDLEPLASEYEPALPRSFRFLIRGLGTRETTSPAMLATLLFTPDYIRRLIEIGEQDAEARKDEIVQFLS